MNQLNDQNTYSLTFHKNTNKNIEIFNKSYRNNLKRRQTMAHINELPPTIPSINGLPKRHKNMPRRPIISGINLHNIAKHITKILVKINPSHLKEFWRPPQQNKKPKHGKLNSWLVMTFNIYIQTYPLKKFILPLKIQPEKIKKNLSHYLSLNTLK